MYRRDHVVRAITSFLAVAESIAPVVLWLIHSPVEGLRTRVRTVHRLLETWVMKQT